MKSGVEIMHEPLLKNRLAEFKEANLAKLEKKWAQVESKGEYTPKYHLGRNAGFTRFVVSEFVNHNNQSGEYVNV